MTVYVLSPRYSRKGTTLCGVESAGHHWIEATDVNENDLPHLLIQDTEGRWHVMLFVNVKGPCYDRGWKKYDATFDTVEEAMQFALLAHASGTTP